MEAAAAGGCCWTWRGLLKSGGTFRETLITGAARARARALLRLLKSREEVASPTAACCLLPAAAAAGGCCWTWRGLLKSGGTFRETLITGAARARARALLRLLKSREEVASPTAACCLLPAAAADGGCCWTWRGLLKSGCTFRETLITGAARALCARCS